jgi:hypothetical protein
LLGSKEPVKIHNPYKSLLKKEKKEKKDFGTP